MRTVSGYLKMRTFISIVAIILTSSVQGQKESFYKKLALLEYGIDFKGDKYGILKNSGDVNYTYDTLIYPNLKKYYFAQKEGKWGVVTMSDNIILPFEYEMVEQTWYNNFTGIDTFIVQKNGYLGTVDFQNNIVIPLKYDAISGWCEYGPSAHYVQLNQKIGLIKHSGEKIIPVEFDDVVYYTPDLILVIKDEKFGIINVNNHVIVPIDNDLIIVDYNLFGKFENENYSQKMYVLKNGRWNLLDQFNNLVEEQLTEKEVKNRLDIETINYYNGSCSNECFIEKIKTTANKK
jgi:hypothetical protein